MFFNLDRFHISPLDKPTAFAEAAELEERLTGFLHPFRQPFETQTVHLSVLKPLRLFLKSKKPDYKEAVSSLRLLFVGAFGMQLLFSLLVGTIAALAVGIQPGGSSLAASVMLIFALLSSPLALLVASFASRGGGKAGAIAAAIALGVLLSTPAWFMLLTLLTGGAPPLPPPLFGDARGVLRFRLFIGRGVTLGWRL